MPQKMYTFMVQGSGEFPYDMLRYDMCWPYRSEDAHMLSPRSYERPNPRRRRVVLQSSNPHGPTDARWDSFMWKVLRDREGLMQY